VVYWRDGSDPEVVRASEAARATFRYFLRELSWENRRVVPAYHLMVVKAVFSEGPHNEHMWIDQIDCDGRTVYGRLIMLARGADANARAKDGTTPLMLATRWRWQRVAELLRLSGAR
jgi:hypothetical protein